ncbi:ABC transporter arginine-binding extracellular protein ArtP [Gottschalkia acidurici 9a]|uniref:ABC transporter arginine-binding extracellular protein ArtP n=1 Tax=Gottschalkia acidurici (strain ATCC 7906 / DSM 604 / BCRC 14475 / CIP 104303 / KCTC 5404 / NCIMB 10678 / 9a) TaxID=1128398 RepID=K0AZP7_GOTA9|nr:transporter substrate-binding domain-containing protein [Gottschalkia acidurici]AFS78257.1 ABC transporter arginine-binding extracellular protein ArtP [Gottschalkia acidurici 9a]
MISKRIKKVLALALTGAMVLSFSGCSSEGGKDKAEVNSLEAIKERGKLIMGTSPDYPPFEFKDKNQDVVGSDVEIAKEIAEDLGVELEINEAQFDSLIPVLQSGKTDIIMAGMNETPDRKKEVDFSDIYYTGEAVLVINKKDVDKFKSLDNLKGKTVGAQLGSIPESIARKELKESEVISIGTVSDLVLQLKGNKMNAVIMDDIVAESYVKNNSDLTIINGIVLKGEEAGFAVATQKGQKDLMREINKTLKRLKDEGKLEKFLEEAMELNNK